MKDEDLKLNYLSEGDLRIESEIIETIVSRLPYAQGDEVTVTEEEFYSRTGEGFLFFEENTLQNLKPYFNKWVDLKVLKSYPTYVVEDGKDVYKFNVDKYLILSYNDKLKEEFARRTRKQSNWCRIENDNFFVILKDNTEISFDFPSPQAKVFFECVFEDWKNNKTTNRTEMIHKISLLGLNVSDNKLPSLRHNLDVKIKKKFEKYPNCIQISTYIREKDTYKLTLNRPTKIIH